MLTCARDTSQASVREQKWGSSPTVREGSITLHEKPSPHGRATAPLRELTFFGACIFR